ncbi:MAG: hypothetical protein O2839_07650 [Cyanobacteria bacterium]|nr:hypothetical protein [Cyanobacteriota bacterium]MDA1247151.1 hypothetical protein [Cyanobacteriota bacterium]
MDDITRRKWEKIADETIDRAIAAVMVELEADPLVSIDSIQRLITSAAVGEAANLHYLR